jgi:hypothetical protein
MTAQPSGERKYPGHIRISFRDDPRPWAKLTLPSRRVWQLTAVFAAFGVGLLTVAGFDIAAVARYFTGSGSEFSPIFEAAGAIIWGIFGLVSAAAALMLGIGTEEIRTGHGFVVHVARIGPLRVFWEIELALVRDLRTAGADEAGLSRICFDYGDVTFHLGSPQPSESADSGVELIQRALDAGGAPQPTPIAPIVRAAPPASRLPIVRVPGWLPIAFLVGSNLLPVVGVLALGWDLGQLMVLFWAENAVIGIYGLAKLIVVERWLAVISVPFFIGHFGLFMALHFIFLYYFFIAGLKGPELNASIILALLAPLWTTILAMFVSHGMSFFSNFLGRQEYVGRKMSSQMVEPYKRVMLLHFTIILGAWAVLWLHQPVAALLLLVALKIAMDLHAHLRERRART